MLDHVTDADQAQELTTLNDRDMPGAMSRRLTLSLDADGTITGSITRRDSETDLDDAEFRHDNQSAVPGQPQQAIESGPKEAPQPVKQIRNKGPKVGRNDPCTCGSGKKFKKCCGAR